ncbi:MAG: hypothetical protein EBV03_13380, partial [Proteobacteria bacterium]|nr:hypothetical protein [Pseudomonadota bacterium]
MLVVIRGNSEARADLGCFGAAGVAFRGCVSAGSVFFPSKILGYFVLELTRFYTHDGESPFETAARRVVEVALRNTRGEVIFRAPAVEVPAEWSDTAAAIVAQRYFYGAPGTP